MTVQAAILSCASSSVTGHIAHQAWEAGAAQLISLGVNTPRRQASMIGQCAHESARFRTRFENLNYSGEGLWRVFRKYFSSPAQADSYARQPERIANRVYANRMDNGSEASGDGWRFRGRGFLQLTGRSNYRVFGGVIGVNLEADPDRAADPELCWLLAASYMARRKLSGRTLLEWADVPDVIMVTKGINGGTHGLQDRMQLTALAYEALSGEASVAEWQSLLLNAGFDPGPIDGLMGPRTDAAIAAAEAMFSLSGEALLSALRSIS
jgi:putative chitinase